MTITAATRILDGVELPAPGVWSIDPGHADIGFIGRHFGLTKVRGRFTGVTGDVVIGENIADSTVNVIIDMASVNSGDQARDEHLRSDDQGCDAQCRSRGRLRRICEGPVGQ